jgi:hypothetical protein
VVILDVSVIIFEVSVIILDVSVVSVVVVFSSLLLLQAIITAAMATIDNNFFIVLVFDLVYTPVIPGMAAKLIFTSKNPKYQAGFLSIISS